MAEVVKAEDINTESCEGNSLKLSESPKSRGARMTIDYCFRSPAKDACEHEIGLELSGTGTDVTAGLKDIKQCGGLTVVQDPRDAEHTLARFSDSTHDEIIQQQIKKEAR